MRNWKKNVLFFAIGSGGYGLIELLWRGYTHWSMLLAGGICFSLFSKIADRFARRSLPYKAGLAAGVVTVVELVFGILFNRILRKNIWDYSDQRFNLLGQICPLYSFFWTVLGLFFIPLAGRLNRLCIK